MRTAILHIGMGRCGSTAIQDTIVQNADRLSRLGFGRPVVPIPGWKRGIRHRGNIANLALYVKAHPDKAPWAIAHFGAAVRTIPEPNCILSSEFLYSWNTQNFSLLRDALNAAGFKIRIVIYLREQREWMISRYAQGVKAHEWTRTLQDYMLSAANRGGLNYFQRIERLAKTFGQENTSVRIFERRRLAENDVRKDFLRAVGIDYADWIFPHGELNRSANLLELELMRANNRCACIDRFDNRDFLEFSTVYKQPRWPGVRELYRLVDPEIMRALHARFARSNEALRRRYFPEFEVPLFRSTIPDNYARFVDGSSVAERLTLLAEYKAHAQSPRPKRRGRARRRGYAGIRSALRRLLSRYLPTPTRRPRRRIDKEG